MRTKIYFYPRLICAAITALLLIIIIVIFALRPVFSVQHHVNRIPAWELEAYDIVGGKGDLNRLAEIVEEHPEIVFSASISLAGLLETSMVSGNCDAVELLLDSRRPKDYQSILEILKKIKDMDIDTCMLVWLDSDRGWSQDQESEIRNIIG